MVSMVECFVCVCVGREDGLIVFLLLSFDGGV